MSTHDPPLQLDERIILDEFTTAHFDGMHIVIEVLGAQKLRLSPHATAMLFWLSRRIQETYPTAFAINLSELPDA
jgi:hypothetical protein